ncbi:metallophosphoesterase [Capillimicrobium parvum]|uniref:Calcineurin-like phosphoesterase domain-containing protein n=1 Tax=Capillimicrobium parvum TaxID=2884022 RepID=A0A9E6XX16_9ACTN|nr:metallophosphoesterase [Capillimicrobium parvum]UGS36062.1 hypothetical protein DSM104329_02460 [Capillimicrobium parvum]
MRARRRLGGVIGTAVAAAALIGADQACAAGATVVRVDSGKLAVIAGAGNANAITVAGPARGALVVRDEGSTVRARAGCTAVAGDTHEVRCPAAGIVSVTIDAADLDDRATVTANLPARLRGGAGDDTLTGGPKDDELTGGGGADTMTGGAGIDEADYADRTAPLTVTIGTMADDGEAGEGDDVGADVEDVVGGTGDDRLTGNRADNVLSGGYGDDALVGGLGTDRLSGGPGSDDLDSRDGTATDTIKCGAGVESATKADPGDKLAGDCERADRSPPVIVAAGDIACDPLNRNFNGGEGTPDHCRQKATAALVEAAHPLAVLTVGDLQYPDGSAEQYAGSYDLSWGRFRAITHPAIGNHEYNTPGAAGYFDYFNGAGRVEGPAGNRADGYYSFDAGPWHVISLNSNCSDIACTAGSAQERWLRADLAANPAACTLAMFHTPRFGSGPHGNSNAVAPLFQALYDGGADLLLAGHDHLYERFAPQDPSGAADPAAGIREFVVGTGGVGFYAFGTPRPNSEARGAGTFGVLALTLHPAGYDWSFLPVPNATGTTFTDSGSGTCH